MAAHNEAAQRAGALGAVAVYTSQPAEWLVRAIAIAQRAPVVVNVGGVPADQVPCIVPLAELERLRKDAELLAALRILCPDLVDDAGALHGPPQPHLTRRTTGVQHRRHSRT